MSAPPSSGQEPSLAARVGARDRLRTRLSVMGQLTTLLALTSTGVVAGVLAHDAQVQDLLAAQRQAEAATPPPAAAPVRKPVRTVVVGVAPKAVVAAQPARKRARTSVKATSPRRRTAAARPSAAKPAPAPVAPKRAPTKAATKSSGS